MHCIFPYYLSYDYNYHGYNGEKSCVDKSDQIQKVNTRCSADTYITTYCETFCPEGVEILTKLDISGISQKYFINKDGEKVQQGALCESLCSNASVWLSYSIEDNVDPHNCQDSCAEPGYGCQACTNKSYFHCKINGEEHCLHPELECDGHSVCDEAKDEQLPGCYDKLVKLGNIDEAATMVCKSIQYPG